MRPSVRLAVVVPIAMGLCFVCFAGSSDSLERADFESNARKSWQGPWGGGVEGGQGGGAFVKAASNEFVRSGKTSARLDVWDDGTSSSIAWSSLRQRVHCTAGAQMKAAVWIYSSSTVAPLASTGVTAQLRIEYFADEDGENLMSSHVVLSTPFGPASGHAPDTWHKLFVSDRVPEGAQCLGLSVVLMSQQPGSAKQSVWVDDAELNLRRPGRGANQPVPRGKVEPNDFPWWKQLFGP